jgi:WhiB family redox-sensing transcriptional regulator
MNSVSSFIGADGSGFGPATFHVSPMEDAGMVFPLHSGEDEMSWQERALCAQTDPESFFPEKGGSTREAKRVCTGCEVKGDCLEYALENDERFGIWGGLSERERRRLKKQAV